MRRQYTSSSLQQQFPNRPQATYKVRLPSDVSLRAEVDAPPSPPLYKTQFLPDPVMTAGLHKLSQNGEHESVPFFQSLDDLRGMRHASRDASCDDMLERALLQMRTDQTALLAADKIRNTQQTSPARQQSCRPIKPSKKVSSRDTPNPRPSLAATHPALYTRIPSKMDHRAENSVCTPETAQRASTIAAANAESAPPAAPYGSARATPCDRDETHDLRTKNTPNKSTGVALRIEHHATSTRSPSADTAHLPRVSLQDPRLSNPLPRHLRCDTESERAGLVSPVVLTTLPFGSVVEAANLYPDESCEKCLTYSSGDGAKCPYHIGEAGTQGFTPWASLSED
ncbi:hypothetical protein BST61_g10534 [Cercospora zeina]